MKIRVNTRGRKSGSILIAMGLPAFPLFEFIPSQSRVDTQINGLEIECESLYCILIQVLSF
jgi:hypothetical protein